MSHLRFPAMGTTVEAWSVADVHRLRGWFATVESICSRFLPDSELSVINDAGDRTHRLSDLMSEVIGEADRLRWLTGGLVDIGVGTAVSEWGYNASFDEVIGLEEAPVRSAPSRWRFSEGTVSIGPGTRLDLGGVAKGWTCDRSLAQGLARVVSAGGDIASADPTTVASVVDPWGDTVARVHLGVGAMATSSTAFRRWEVAGEEVSHIIDPRTMGPAKTPIVSMTVVARSAVNAEAGAKAALLHGVDGLAWAAGQEWIDSAIAVWHDRSVYATRAVPWAA